MQTITDFYTNNDKVTDRDCLEILVETENITVSVWKDQNLFYLFDPYPRDGTGQVMGKDGWSAKLEAPKIDVDADAGAASTTKPAEPPTDEGGAGDGKTEAEKEEEKPKRPKSRQEYFPY